MHRSLGRPHMRADVGNVLGKVVEKGHAELGVLLIARVVGELAESLGVERLPIELIEEGNLLREARAQGIELVL